MKILSIVGARPNFMKIAPLAAELWGNRDLLADSRRHVERLLATLGAIVTVPGAVGAFRTAALHALGGVSDDTIAEDTDLTSAIQRAGWRVTYQDDAIAWTEAPSTVGDLWRQRYRWCYGTLQAVWKHRRALVERRSIGWLGLPYALVFQVAVALLGPLGGVAALYGPLHGGANVGVMQALEQIGSVEGVEPYVKETLAKPGGRVMGFGHRVYRADWQQRVAA